MPKDRFFYSGNLQKDETICIEGEEARHIRSVMRKSPGDLIEIINGKGALAEGAILQSDDNRKKALYLKITSATTEAPKKLKTILIQSIIRPQKLELVIEKACELGVQDVLMVKADYSDKSAPKRERLDHIAISALKQSGRLHLPKLEMFDSLDEALKLTQTCSLYYGDIQGQLISSLCKECSHAPLAFFIGPEGGFSKREMELLSAQKATAVTFGPYILRSETASILACGAMASRL